MVTAFVSPGAYWREQDYSDYIPGLATTICGMVGTASWGPVVGKEAAVSVPQLITNEAELIRIFGAPGSDHLGLHAARQYLRHGSQLLFSRVIGTAVKADVTILDDLSSGAGDAATFTARYYGTRGNDVRVVIAAGASAGLINFFVEVIPDTSQAYVNTDYQKWIQVEEYYGLSLDDGDAETYFETVINDGTRDLSKSAYVTVVDDRTDTGTHTIGISVGTFRLGDSTPLLVSAATAGTDGTGDITEADYVGEPTILGSPGLQAFANPEVVDVNMLAIPGQSGSTVIQGTGGLLDMCENTRRDAIALIDPPIATPPATVGADKGIVDWHNGLAAEPNPQIPLDSSYGALYWPWLEVNNPWTGTELWIPPSGHVAGTYAFNDYIAEPWYAPAGFNRGRIAGALRCESTPTLGQRNAMYSNLNAVNPIMTFPRDGIAVWGQRTLQRRPTKRDRVSTRRLMLTIEKQIATAVKYLTFEPNDERTWKAFTNLTTPLMDFVKSRRGVEDFRIICDSTTNPPILRNRNTMNGRILLTPMATAEIIVVDFVLYESGASFAER